MKKKVIITGAGDFLGKSLVEEFLVLGWKVFAGYLAGDIVPKDTDLLTNFVFNPIDDNHILATRKKINAPVDMLIINIDKQFGKSNYTILDDLDLEELKQSYDYNTLGSLRLVDAFLPLLEKGNGKRICLVTTEKSSNNITYNGNDYCAHVPQAALNMAMTQLFNGLRKKGYTFRLYCKNEDIKNNNWAVEYFTQNRSYEPEDPIHSDENRIVLRNWQARELPW